jgi:lysophospholipase L1-like esterase
MTFLSRIAGTTCLIGLCLVLGEGVLRIVPSPVQYPPLYDYDYKDSLLGIQFFPNTVHTERTACYTSTITTNAHGWRDKERSEKRIPGLTRIAVLGDSFMAGTQVNDDQVFARQLETILGSGKVEVLNFGISSTGTEQQDILYEKVVSAFKPDIVLLAFYSNDPMNSDPQLEGGPERKTRLTYRGEDGELVSFRQSTPLDGTRHWLRSHSALYRMAVLTYRMARQAASPAGEVAGYPPYPKEFHVFDAPANADWERGWSRVDRAVASLKSQIAPKHLIAFSAPEMLQTAPDPKALLQKQYGVDPPADFRPTYPSERFAKIAKKHGVPFIDLIPVFVDEQQKRTLEYPYLYFTCDGHWNALGHRIAAETVAKAVKPLLAR